MPAPRWWAALCVLCSLVTSSGRAATPNEYEIRAVFLYHLAGFVTWPANALGDPKAPLVIGVVGTDPFGRYLDEVVAGETAQGHPLQVARFAQAKDVGRCHILFVSAGAEPGIEGILAALGHRPVLTVGETEGFARRGGMIRFLPGNRTRIRVNLTAARNAGLVISSKLLRVADVISPEK